MKLSVVNNLHTTSPDPQCTNSLPAMMLPLHHQVNRILGLTLNTKYLRDRLMDTSAHMNEANLAHARAMNKASHSYSHAAVCSGSSIVVLRRAPECLA